MTTPTLLGKTTRNLSQFAEKKLVGKAHTRADRNDVSEGIPSNIQITTRTIFGEEVPSTPADNIDQIGLYDVDSNNRIQKIELVATVINGTSYNAAESEADGGGDSPQNTGPHAYSLSLPADYENPTGETNNNPKKGTGPYVDGKRIFDTLGTLQIVPTNLFIDPTFSVTNPYGPKVYYNDRHGSPAGFMGLGDPIDWFVDPYAGIVFLQEYDQDKIPYKVECFIYIGDMADQTTGGTTTIAGCTDTDTSGVLDGQVLVYNSGTLNWEPQDQSGGVTTLAGLTDTDVSGVTNNQVLTYNAANLAWEAQDTAAVGGIERYLYVETSTTSAKQAITVPGMDFNGATPTAADTKVYLNGLLQLGGTNTQLNNNEVDYHFSSDTEIKLINDTNTDDSLTIFYTTTSFSTGKDFLLHTDDAAFDNARVITAGDGITITKPSAPNERTFVISNSGLVQRSKSHITSTGTYDTGGSNPDVFTMTDVDFSFDNASHSYSDDRIDLFLAGVLLIKDVQYQLKDADNTLGVDQFRLMGSTSISNGDIVTAILF